MCDGEIEMMAWNWRLIFPGILRTAAVCLALACVNPDSHAQDRTGDNQANGLQLELNPSVTRQDAPTPSTSQPASEGPVSGLRFPVTDPGNRVGESSTNGNSGSESGTANPANGQPGAGNGNSLNAGQNIKPPEDPLKAQVVQRIEQLQVSEATPELKGALTKLYQQITADLNTALQLEAEKNSWNVSAETAPELLVAAKAEKEKLRNGKPQEGLLFMSFEEGQARLRSLEADLATVTAERARLSDEIVKREKRRKELPQLISDSKLKLEQLVVPTSEQLTEDPLIAEALVWSAEATRRKLSEQLRALESEQRSYDAEAQLLPLQLELTQARERQLTERVQAVNEELSKIREDRILSKRGELYDMLKGRAQEVKEQGDLIFERIDQWLELSKKQVAVKTELKDSRTRLDYWKAKRKKMDARVEPDSTTVESSGFNSWVGMMLRKELGELPDPQRLSSRIHHYQKEIQDSDSLLYDIEDALISLEANEGLLAENESNEVQAARELKEKSKEILQAMKVDLEAYQSDLIDIADIQQQLKDSVRDYRNFIDKHVLWIRSCEPPRQQDYKSTIEAFQWIATIENWKGMGRLLAQDFMRRFWWYILIGAGLLVLFLNQTSIRRQIGALGNRAERRNCTDFTITFRTFLLTLIVAIPIPLVAMFVAWRIEVSIASGMTADVPLDFARAFQQGLWLLVAVFVPLELLRQVCRAGGLGVKHFEWDKAITQRLGGNLRWLIDLIVPLSLLIGMISTTSHQRWESSLGRLCFVILMPMLSVFFARTFTPSTGVFSNILKKHADGWLERLKYFWYFGLILGPLVLVGVSVIGYHYTAQRIAFHLVTTLWAAVVLVLLFLLAERWLLLNRRKLILLQARQRLEGVVKRETTTASLGIAETPEANIVDISEQTMRLLTGLFVAIGLVVVYVIWSDILPAISFLETVRLWRVEGDVPGEKTWITLANLVLVIPIIILLFIAARNVPGLLEIAVLQHLPLTGAVRYAITTLTRYAIIGIGIAVASSTIGLRWQSVQWLVAALGVGLGFGLQEIFANFVSGVILLFEQPIRVGDVITIDGTTGAVAKIRMRATTIVNWDRQELVVPNKDLITGKLLNWTLSDTTNRISLEVGIGYGCDTRQACQKIRDILEQHPNVLKEPVPTVTITSFGDNAIILTVRGFLQTLDQRLITTHELFEAIYLSFNEAGIEIAYPQRDVHLRSLPNLVTKWFQSQVAAESEATVAVDKKE